MINSNQYAPNPNPISSPEFTVKKLPAGGYLVTVPNDAHTYGPSYRYAATSLSEVFSFLRKEFGEPPASTSAYTEEWYRNEAGRLTESYPK